MLMPGNLRLVWVKMHILFAFPQAEPPELRIVYLLTKAEPSIVYPPAKMAGLTAAVVATEGAEMPEVTGVTGVVVVMKYSTLSLAELLAQRHWRRPARCRSAGAGLLPVPFATPDPALVRWRYFSFVLERV